MFHVFVSMCVDMCKYLFTGQTHVNYQHHIHKMDLHVVPVSMCFATQGDKTTHLVQADGPKYIQRIPSNYLGQTTN